MANFPLKPRLAKVGKSEGSPWPSSPSSPGSPRLAKVKGVDGRVPPRAQTRQGRSKLRESLGEFPFEPRHAKVVQRKGMSWPISPSSLGSPRLEK